MIARREGCALSHSSTVVAVVIPKWNVNRDVL